MSAAELFPPRRRPAPVLERIAFRTSRLAEFCSINELAKQTGRPADEWPLVILKEVVDNALDGCEEAEIAPEITVEVSTETGEVVIEDNGMGIPADTIASVIDYNIRVSSREAYVSPSRGQQGNALKCIVAMPFALDGTRGTTIIESRGQTHTIIFDIDRVRREPKIDHQIGPSDVQTGTRVTVRWPSKASSLLEDARARFVQLAGNFTTFNPHLTLRCHWDDEESVNVPATNPGWRKWRTCDFTSAYWYDRSSFERYIAAHIKRDHEQGRTGRTVRDFIKELRGLRRPDAQKLVLAETESARVPLDEYFGHGDAAVARLLDACQRHTEPVKPKALGLIGAEHLHKDCLKLGAASASFRYRKHLDTTETGLPYVLEVAFAWRPEASGRLVIAGTNFSIAIGNAFTRLGYYYDDLNSVLAQHLVQSNDRCVVVLHYACPGVEFSDHGKTTLTLPRAVGRAAMKLLAQVTKDWEAQRRAELRSTAAEARRSERLLKEKEKPQKTAAAEPSGVLAEKITRAAAAAGVSVDDLTVLSRDNDPYTAWRRRPDAELFATLFNHFVTPGEKRHLRGLFYRCVMMPDAATWPTGKPLINTYANWIKFQKAAAAARWLGLVAFDRIIDARNDEPKIYVPDATPISTSIDPGAECEIPHAAEEAFPRLRLSGFQGRQTHRIILYGEKTSLSEIADPIARSIRAEMVLVTGESSNTRLAEAIARANADGRPAVLLYLADCDPAGHQMAISVARKVQALIDFQYPDLNIKLYRVALTVDQVRSWGLPDKPIPPKERRADKWRAAFGVEQTEIDAAIELKPAELRQAILEAIAPFYDDTLERRVREAEDAGLENAGQLLEAHPDYQDCRKRIAASYEYVEDAVTELREEQERAAEILRSTLPAPPELPKAAPTGIPKPPQFDSDWDFVTATRRLIADKKLSGEVDDDSDGDEQ